jgi:phosphoglucosamine mutase
VLTRRHGLDLAAVVSASHNPYRDNGIKFFGGNGLKLGDDAEARIEERLESAPEPGTAVGRVRPLRGAFEDYIRELSGRFRLDLSGVRVALDCANGATSKVAPAIFSRLGAEVEALAAEPDGRNINDGCGSTHPEGLAAHVRASGADLGFAFDGDGDRVIAVDREGEIRDGDELIALAALHLAQSGELSGGIVVTVMSNYGFHRAMRAAGIEVVTTDVGDRNVLAELRERDWRLGGEQSGHIIAMDLAPTGDGIGGALLALEALAGRDLAEVSPIERLPQRLENVTVADRDALAEAAAVWEAVEEEGTALDGRGRVLVRSSGTEPLVRVMVEAPDADECEEIASRLAKTVETELG